MNVIMCDRCGREVSISSDITVIESRGGLYKELCKVCYKEFVVWLGDESEIIMSKPNSELEDVLWTIINNSETNLQTINGYRELIDGRLLPALETLMAEEYRRGYEDGANRVERGVKFASEKIAANTKNTKARGTNE